MMAPDRKISTNLTEMIIITPLRERERERERERQLPWWELSELKLLTAVTHVLVGNIWRGTWHCILGEALGTWLIFCNRSDNSTLNISSALCRLTDWQTNWFAMQQMRCNVGLQDVCRSANLNMKTFGPFECCVVVTQHSAEVLLQIDESRISSGVLHQNWMMTRSQAANQYSTINLGTAILAALCLQSGPTYLVVQSELGNYQEQSREGRRMANIWYLTSPDVTWRQPNMELSRAQQSQPSCTNTPYTWVGHLYWFSVRVVWHVKYLRGERTNNNW